MNTSMVDSNLFIQLITGGVVGFVAAYIGSLMVIKRMALAGDALSHLALPGVGLALAWHFDISLGALISLIIGLVILWKLEHSTTLSLETLTAVIFATALAATLLIIPMEDLEVALLGNLATISCSMALIACVISIALFICIRFIYMHEVLISFNKDLAQSMHIKIAHHDLGYLMCVAVIVALGVKIVGGLLLAALVAIPAATSRNLSHTIFGYRILSSCIGALATLLGILTAHVFFMPFGPTIILVNALFFLFSLFIADHS